VTGTGREEPKWWYGAGRITGKTGGTEFTDSWVKLVEDGVGRVMGKKH
jgi:hypothetical protein